MPEKRTIVYKILDSILKDNAYMPIEEEEEPLIDNDTDKFADDTLYSAKADEDEYEGSISGNIIQLYWLFLYNYAQLKASPHVK